MAYNNVKVKARQVVAHTSMRTKDLGTVSEVPMGEWNNEISYKKLNLVRYNGATYVATQDNKNSTPAIDSMWQLLSMDGRGVKITTISYQAGISGTVPPTNDWSSEIPDVPQGQYLWTRTLIQYSDNSQTISYSVSLQGLNFTQQDRDDIDRITNAIPSNASADNPLATHDFVNSSINNIAAYAIEYNAVGNAFPTYASLIEATVFYNGGKVRIPTQNDYATVIQDETQPKNPDGKYPTTRYTYQGGTYPNGQWGFWSIVNNTPFTQAQLDAINSGITAQKIVETDNNINGKVSKSGDIMTGALELPQLLGVGESAGRGITPVRYITRQELNAGVSDGVDAYIQAWLKKVCELYPNIEHTIYLGAGNPSSEIIIYGDIYNTSERNDDGMPRYCVGIAKQYGEPIRLFNVKEYVYDSCLTITTQGGQEINSKATVKADTGEVSMNLIREDNDIRINLDIAANGTDRGVWDKQKNWLLKTDGTNVYVDGVVPYSTKNRPTATSYSSTSITNANNQTDTVVSYYRSANGATWYRTWSSGWKECGGYIRNETTSSNALATVNFPLTFSQPPSLQITKHRSSATTTATSIKELGYVDVTEKSFQLYNSTNHRFDVGLDYYACGV